MWPMCLPALWQAYGRDWPTWDLLTTVSSPRPRRPWMICLFGPEG